MKVISAALLATLCLILVGCGSAPQPTVSPEEVAQAKLAKSDLSSKLKAMAPEERVRYVKEHSAEVNTILRGSGFGMGPRPHTPSR